MISLNYTEYGQGRPVIILHGLFGSARNWQGIARSLAENHHVIAPDLRNHGLSPHVDSMSYEEMAADVISLADKLKLNDIILVGHSMGGKVAMTAALQNSARFSAMIVVDIAPVNYSHGFEALADAMNSLDLKLLNNRNDAEAELAKTTNETGVVQFILQNLIRSDGNFCWRINLEQISASLSSISGFPDSLNNISNRLPTLFLGGTESKYLLSIYNTAIYQYFPSSEITMIEGAGHWLHAEKPSEFLKEVKNFINYV
jgi:esterase